jgi:hypothetical protein
MRDSNFDKALIEFYMKHVSSSLQHAHMKIICELFIEITYFEYLFCFYLQKVKSLKRKIMQSNIRDNPIPSYQVCVQNFLLVHLRYQQHIRASRI